MANYSKTTNFTAKDSLASGDPNKVIKGSEHDTEYDNIATASATKADKVTSATDHNLLMMDASGNLEDSTIATNGTGTITATFVGNITGDVTGNCSGTASGLSGSNLSGDVTNSGNAITIANLAVETGMLANDAVTSAKRDWTIASSGVWNMSGSSNQVLPEGVVNWVSSNNSAQLQIYVSGAWRAVGSSSNTHGCAWSDGVNMRLTTGLATSTVYYQVL